MPMRDRPLRSRFHGWLAGAYAAAFCFAAPSAFAIIPGGGPLGGGDPPGGGGGAVVPEAGSLALLGAAGLALMGYHWLNPPRRT
jgi:hypothetical protein